MKRVLAVLMATAATVTLTACATESEAVTRAGGEEAILQAAERAQGRCHRETKYNGTPLTEAEYIFDEFRAAYVEKDGQYIRHVITGSVDIRDGDKIDNVAYLCGYVQRQSQEEPASRDDFGALTESRGFDTSTANGQSLLDLRDDLRAHHDVERDDVLIYEGHYPDEVAEAEAHREDAADSDDSVTTILTTTTMTRASTAPTSETAEPSEPSTTFQDGIHMVGTDIQPGTYRTDGGRGCYWERLSGLGGTSSDRITNHFSRERSQTYVTIAPSDMAFDSRKCGTWEMVP